MKTLIEAIIISTIAVLAPVKATVVAVSVLIIADLILGVLAAKKRGEPITSAGLRRTITKFTVYNCAIIIAFILQTYLIGESLPAVKLISGIIGITEGKSLLESLDVIYGKPIFLTVVQKLGSKNDTSTGTRE